MRSRAAAALLALSGLFLIVGIAGQRWELVSLLLPLTSIVLLYALLWRPADLVMSATWDIKTERAFAGDTVESVLTLRYQGKGGRIGVVDVTLPHSVEVVEGDAKFPLLLGAHGELQVTYKLRFPRRGVYILGPIKGTTMDLAGMTSTVCEARSAAEVRVSPRVFEIDRHPPKTSKLHTAAGNINSKLLGPGIDFFNLRGYVPGDSLKMINWKATARTDGLVVSQFMTQRSCDVVVALDTRDVKDTVLLDHAVEIAASLCGHFIGQRDRVGLVVFGDFSKIVPIGQGRRQLHRILEVLTEVEKCTERPPLKVVESIARYFPHDSLIVYISDLGNEDIVSIAQHLVWQRRELTVVAPYLPLDREDLAGRMRGVRKQDRAFRLEMMCPVEQWDGGDPATWSRTRGA